MVGLRKERVWGMRELRDGQKRGDMGRYEVRGDGEKRKQGWT